MGTSLHRGVQITGNLEAVTASGDGVPDTVDGTPLVLDE